MNKTYRSIWNASLGCYVAAPECAASHSAGTSRSRVARAHPKMRSGTVMALEARVLFDGAMVSTAMTVDSVPPSIEAPAIEAAAPAPAPAALLVPPAVETPASSPASVSAPTAPQVSTAVSDPLASPAPAAPAATEVPVATLPAQPAAAAETDMPAAVEPLALASQEVVFIDARVPDPAAFEGENRQVIVLSMEQDGLSQIAAALHGRSDISAIHIVSHGSGGVLTLGNSEVTVDSIQSAHMSHLQSIGQALSADGDILIYACDFVSGESGLEAMHLLADITGADVAASVDATGHESLGANWTLEQSTGAVEVQSLAPLAWMHALDFAFTGAGTVGAMGMANNIMGAGVTVVSATYQGGATQAGTFSSGSGVTFGSNVLGFTSGTLLSTSSNAAGVAGPNSVGNFGQNASNGIDGDAALNAMAGTPTFDAAILSVSFVPDVPPGGSVGDVGRMTLEIVFGSEEYLEYVGQINDVMEVSVNGQIVSLVPNSTNGESTIGIDSINSTQNRSLFINNASAVYNTQMDGFTVTIPIVFDVVVGQSNTIRLAVADAFDTQVDSWLFVRADSGQTVVVAEDDEVTTATNLPITVDLTANDYNLAGGTMSLTHIQGQTVSEGQVITLGSGIQLTVGTGGQVTVTGNGSSAANDTFTYQVSNGLGGIASATVNVEVTPPNLNPPVAQNDVEAVLANATLTDSVLTNNGNGADTDPNGNPLSVVQVNLTGFTAGTPIALPSGAQLSMNVNGTYVYNPNGAFDSLVGGATATDSFSYTVTDGQGGNDTATVTITVTGVNDAPAAIDDSFTVSEDGAIYLGSMDANDTDVDGSIANVGYYRGGTLNPADYPVLFSSELTVAKWTANSDDGVAGGLDARGVDTQVVQAVSNLTAGPGLNLTGNASRLSAEVSGLNSANLTEARANGDYIDVSFTTLDRVIDVSSLALGILDSNGLGAGYTLTVEVLPEGDPARAQVLSASHTLPGPAAPSGYEWNQWAVDASVLLNPETHYVVRIYLYGNPSDSTAEFNDFHIFHNDRGPIPISVLSAGDQGGVFSFDDSGGVVFNPNGDFDDLQVGQSRDTHWVYTVRDNEGATSSATVTVTVQGVNDTPIVSAEAYGAAEDGAYFLGNPLDNDSDPEGDSLSVQIDSAQGSNGGTLVQDESGGVVFIAGSAFDDLSAGQTRETTFSLTVFDSQGASSNSQVVVTVQGANDAPQGQDDYFTVSEANAIELSNLANNDVDPEGGEVLIDSSASAFGDNGGMFSFGDGGSGSLVFNPNGQFNDLAVGETRTTRFSYTLFDSFGASSTATVHVEVVGLNDTPVAGLDSFEVNEGQGIALTDILANDSDADGESLAWSLVNVLGSHGGLLVMDDGLSLYFNDAGDFESLGAGETQETRFVYDLEDSSGGITQGEMVVIVRGVNDDPFADHDSFDVDASMATVLGSVLGNDSDVDGDILSVQLFSAGLGSQGGTFSVDEDGVLSFDSGDAFDDLAVGDTRDTSFVYTISDGQGGLASATVTVTVHGVEQAGDGDEGETTSGPTYPNQIVFVDGRISNPQAFAIGGRELVVLNLEEDGLTQMANVLVGRTGIEAVHIVSHGGSGYLTLGTGGIDTATISSQLTALDAIGQAMTADGDILVYACDFAFGIDGQNAMQLLAQYTLADVAGSDDTTGDASLGGDWTLEVAVGPVETAPLAPEGWLFTLDRPSSPNADSSPVVAAAAAALPAISPSEVAPSAVEALVTPAPTSSVVVASTLVTGSAESILTDTVSIQQPAQPLEALGAVRVVSLEQVFRETVSPYMASLSSDALPSSQKMVASEIAWTVSVEAVDTRIAQPEGWQPTVEVLDDSLVDEELAGRVVKESEEDEALAVPRQQAAPGFTAQLTRWSHSLSQRPLTRASARV